MQINIRKLENVLSFVSKDVKKYNMIFNIRDMHHCYENIGKKRTTILSSIGVGIPTRHVSTVRTINSFDTGESQRSKCPRVKDRP